MTNFSIAAIMNNSGSQNRGVDGESRDIGSLTSISESGIALTNRIHQQQLSSLREHAFLQLGRRGFDESSLSPLSRCTKILENICKVVFKMTFLNDTASLRPY
jgi:hypothetical protein